MPSRTLEVVIAGRDRATKPIRAVLKANKKLGEGFSKTLATLRDFSVVGIGVSNAFGRITSAINAGTDAARSEAVSILNLTRVIEREVGKNAVEAFDRLEKAVKAQATSLAENQTVLRNNVAVFLDLNEVTTEGALKWATLASQVAKYDVEQRSATQIAKVLRETIARQDEPLKSNIDRLREAGIVLDEARIQQRGLIGALEDYAKQIDKFDSRGNSLIDIIDRQEQAWEKLKRTISTGFLTSGVFQTIFGDLVKAVEELDENDLVKTIQDFIDEIGFTLIGGVRDLVALLKDFVDGIFSALEAINKVPLIGGFLETKGDQLKALDQAIQRTTGAIGHAEQRIASIESTRVASHITDPEVIEQTRREIEKLQQNLPGLRRHLQQQQAQLFLLQRERQRLQATSGELSDTFIGDTQVFDTILDKLDQWLENRKEAISVEDEARKNLEQSVQESSELVDTSNELNDSLEDRLRMHQNHMRWIQDQSKEFVEQVRLQRAFEKIKDSILQKARQAYELERKSRAEKIRQAREDIELAQFGKRLQEMQGFISSRSPQGLDAMLGFGPSNLQQTSPQSLLQNPQLRNYYDTAWNTPGAGAHPQFRRDFGFNRGEYFSDQFREGGLFEQIAGEKFKEGDIGTGALISGLTSVVNVFQTLQDAATAAFDSMRQAGGQLFVDLADGAISSEEAWKKFGDTVKNNVLNTIGQGITNLLIKPIEIFVSSILGLITELLAELVAFYIIQNLLGIQSTQKSTTQAAALTAAWTPAAIAASIATLGGALVWGGLAVALQVAGTAMATGLSGKGGVGGGMAEGGVMTKPGIIAFAEKRPEAAIPIYPNSAVAEMMQPGSAGMLGGTTINVYVEGDGDEEKIRRAVRETHEEMLRSTRIGRRKRI